jgi:hypothetical protein
MKYWVIVLVVIVLWVAQAIHLNYLRQNMEQQWADSLRVSTTNIHSQLEAEFSGKFDTLWNHVLFGAYAIPDTVYFCGQLVPMWRPRVREKVEFEVYKFLRQRNNLVLWYKLIGRYFPMIEEQLNTAQAPDDGKYAVILESLLDPRARSGKFAVGLWQFIGPTGAHYGLRQTGVLDQRMDPWLATNAARRHMLDLYRLTAYQAQYHDWFLAWAQYVCSPNRVGAAMRQQGHNDYFNLLLPRDAERYVPQIIALKIIFSNPHGFGLDVVEQYAPLPESATVIVNLPKGGTLQTLADGANISMDDFLLLNSAYLGSKLPPGLYTVRTIALGSSTAVN